MLGCDPWAITPEANRTRSSYTVECRPSFQRTMTPADMLCSRTFPRTTAKWTFACPVVVAAQETVVMSHCWSILTQQRKHPKVLFENVRKHEVTTSRKNHP